MFVSLFKSFRGVQISRRDYFYRAPLRSSPIALKSTAAGCIASGSIDVVFSAFCQANVFEYVANSRVIFAPQRLVVGSAKSSSDARGFAAPL